MVLFFGDHKLEKRTLREMKKGSYRFTFDTAFDAVVAQCAAPRDYNRHSLTWITPRFKRLYAESAQTWSCALVRNLEWGWRSRWRRLRRFGWPGLLFGLAVQP